MDKETIKAHWSILDRKVDEYEKEIRRKLERKGLDKIILEKRVRNNINRKFKEESTRIMGMQHQLFAQTNNC